MASPTLRSLKTMPTTPAPLSKSVLVLIDCQNTYREGVMRLEGVEPALAACAALLARARTVGAPVIHIQHDGGPGSPYDIGARLGAIAEPVAPAAGERVIVKKFPNSFLGTGLDGALKDIGATDLVLAGFMTHMCVNSTARGAFNLGYRPTVVGSATATRGLPNPLGGELTAKAVHDGALTALADLFAVVVPDEGGVPQ